MSYRLGLALGCVLIVIGLWVGSLAGVPAQAAVPSNLSTVDAYLQEQVQAQHFPGLAVAIVQGDQPILVRGYGEAGPGRPMTAQTQFYLGSVTKSFTALAVMQLVEQGRLDLDAPVQRYLPWFQVADSQASAQITVRHLLNQTSGLSEATDPGANRYAPTLTEQVRLLQQAPLAVPVGSRFQYDSQNYRVLGLLIEQVSGQPYGEYLHDHVFNPLGMAHTVADPAAASELAQGYGQAFGIALPRQQVFRPGALPSGYLISSAEEMAHYLIALLNEGQYNSQSIVRPDTLRQMLTPPVEVESDYGMGWVVTESSDGIQVIYHTGALENFYTAVMLLPEQQIGFALLCNQNSLFQMLTGHDAVMIGLANLLVGDPVPASGTLDWLNWLLAGLAALSVLIALVLLWRLPRWAMRAARRPRLLQWAAVLLNLALPVAVLLFLPRLLGMVLGGGTGTWSEFYGLLPDIALWLLTLSGLGLIRAVAQGALLMRRRSRFFGA
jgi:CubicO group peptidase (beta-lactamase class C family)